MASSTNAIAPPRPGFCGFGLAPLVFSQRPSDCDPGAANLPGRSSSHTSVDAPRSGIDSANPPGRTSRQSSGAPRLGLGHPQRSASDCELRMLRDFFPLTFQQRILAEQEQIGRSGITFVRQGEGHEHHSSVVVPSSSASSSSVLGPSVLASVLSPSSPSRAQRQGEEEEEEEEDIFGHGFSLD